MRIKDIMKKEFLYVKGNDLIEKVLDIMRKSKVNSLPVVDSGCLLVSGYIPFYDTAWSL